jgi:U4/U6.U5 tri-snRNP component SNU23
MSSNLNYKQVAQVTRRKWDSETYEKRAQDRRAQSEEAASTGNNNNNRNNKAAQAGDGDDNGEDDGEDHKEEFQRASQDAVGPEGSDRAFLKARRGKVDIDDKVGTKDLVSAEAAATSSTAAEDGVASGVVKTGIGWHCKVCDCFLKDSLTYLDHINGRKHQRKLGFSMRVERTSKDSLMNKLSQLTKRKESEEKRSAEVDPADDNGPNYDDIVKAKDAEAETRKEERANKRRERKQRLKQTDEGEEDEDEETAQLDPAMAAMMGFSGFGGGK